MNNTINSKNNWDLTWVISKFLDKHLILPLLQEHINSDKKLYDIKSIEIAQFEIVNKTQMIEYSIDLQKQIHSEESDIPKEMIEEVNKVYDKLQKNEDESEHLYNKLVAFQEEKLEEWEKLSNKTKTDYLENLKQMAKFRFECGQYNSNIVEHLTLYRDLIDQVDISKQKQKNTLRIKTNSSSANQGILAASILQAQQNDDENEIYEAQSSEQLQSIALDYFKELESFLNFDNSSKKLYFDQVELLTQRSQLLHWSLFIFFNIAGGHNLLIDLFVKENWMVTIQTSCTHLLRYLIVSLVIERERTTLLDEVIRIIEQEKENYTDPILEFITCLKLKYDFEGAKNNLRLCRQILDQDFFLCSYQDLFIENARLLFFEALTNVHSRIDFDYLSDCLNLNFTDSKILENSSITDYSILAIKKLGLKAVKVDSKNNCIVICFDKQDGYGRILSRSKVVVRRYDEMLNKLNKKISSNSASNLHTLQSRA